LSESIQNQLASQVSLMAKGLNVIGLMNAQFAIQGENIYVLEVNPRASRTVPFVSKAIGIPIAKIAVNCMVGNSLASQGIIDVPRPDYYCVKESVFPFIKFPGVDPLLGPEMKSTGEVMGIGKTFGEAFAKGQSAAGEILSASGHAFISVKDFDKELAINIASELVELGFEIYATSGTSNILNEAGVKCKKVNKVREGEPHIVNMLENKQIDLIVNTTEDKNAITDSFSIRRTALQQKVFYTTTIAAAQATVEALKYSENSNVNSLQTLHKGIFS
jgi:carbamoyl-phosphate synthase large subunit